MMNSKLLSHAVLGAALVCGVGIVSAQESAPPPPNRMMHGGPGDFGPGSRMELLGFGDLHGGKVVKGAPFSAHATTDTTHTLQDGTVVHRTESSAIYRDSQGRSRREMTLSGFGPLQATGKTRNVITIGDPVAGVHSMLDPDKKIAHQMKMHVRNSTPEGDTAFQARMQARMQKEEASGNVKNESLGTQNIEGVNAQGTRITRTIPAGQIGNDRPIQVVFERWYSPDLQVVVKSTRTDPRFGTTTYALSGIQRTEPAASLFTVPSDFTIEQGRHGMRHGGMRGPRSTTPATPPATDNN